MDRLFMLDPEWADLGLTELTSYRAALLMDDDFTTILVRNGCNYCAASEAKNYNFVIDIESSGMVESVSFVDGLGNHA